MTAYLMGALRWPGEVAGTLVLFLVSQLPDPVRAVEEEHPVGAFGVDDPLLPG